MRFPGADSERSSRRLPSNGFPKERFRIMVFTRIWRKEEEAQPPGGDSRQHPPSCHSTSPVYLFLSPHTPPPAACQLPGLVADGRPLRDTHQGYSSQSHHQVSLACSSNLHGSLAAKKIRSELLSLTFKAWHKLVLAYSTARGPCAPGELACTVCPVPLVPSVSSEPSLDMPSWPINLSHLEGQAFIFGERHLQPTQQVTNYCFPGIILGGGWESLHF